MNKKSIIYTVIFIQLVALLVALGLKSFTKQSLLSELALNMVEIPSGEFLMGDQEGESGTQNGKRVVIEGFQIMAMEITHRQWELIMGENNNRTFPECGDECPVIEVSWDDVQEFIIKLNAQTGKSFRLPSESEWEYVARAGSSTSYSWGDTPNCLNASYKSDDDSACQTQSNEVLEGPKQVGSYKANAYGVYDMHGNAGEWVQDCYSHSWSRRVVNNLAWEYADCDIRVYRGGSWIQNAEAMTSYHRHYYFQANTHAGVVGFRLAHD